MNTGTAPEPAATPPTPVALFGRDANGRPHCSYFAGGEAESATQAAAAMGMHVLPLAGPECDGLADQMPAGRLFASGKAFVPFCKQPLFDRLAALGGIKVEPVPPKAAKLGNATAAKVKGESAPTVDAKVVKKAAPTPKSTVAPYVEPTNIPQDWPHIREGSLVLASNGEDHEAWWKCIIVEVKEDALCACIWAGWETPLFLRRRNQLALLPEGTPLKESE